jgi:enoyl-CoA hydratase
LKFSDYERLRFERRDHGVLLITMDRPEKYNAADEQMHGELARVWAEVSADRETRVAVITGAGRAFSAGGDLDMVTRMAGNHDRVAHMLAEMSDLVYNIINCEKPVVSAINGVAVGAGTVVALLADISICALDARIGDGHVKLGVAAGDHAAILWPLLCGMAKARYYLLTGEMITGEEAERLGMVSKAVPREEVLGEALRVADSLATGSQLAIRWTKRALNNWLKMAGPVFDQSAAYEMLCFMGPDVLEGAAALSEKRAPRFPSARDSEDAGQLRGSSVPGAGPVRLRHLEDKRLGVRRTVGRVREGLERDPMQVGLPLPLQGDAVPQLLGDHHIVQHGVGIVPEAEYDKGLTEDGVLRVEGENPQGQVRPVTLLGEPLKLLVHHRLVADPALEDRFIEHDR